MSDIVLAISSYQSNVEVLNILNKIKNSKNNYFIKIIIVDSMPNEVIHDYLRDNALDVDYIFSDFNLGSAGNLKVRLEHASKVTNAKWCLCLNHDAFYSEDFIDSFINCKAMNYQMVGAIFPTRVYDKNSNFEKIITNDSELCDWGSSNGCIYSLEAFKTVQVRDDLWMGWEDYLYCFELKEEGYSNYLVDTVPFIDPYEYKNISFGPFELTINDKPAWYDYYSIRNFIYSMRVVLFKKTHVKMLGKVIINSIVLSFFRDNTITRLKNFVLGFCDGLIGKMGKREL